MKRTRLIAPALCALLLAALLSGCTHHPLDDFQSWLEKSESGDLEAFRAGFTTRSRQFLDGVLTLGKRHPELRFPKRFTGKTRVLTPRDQVRIRGNRAELEVSSNGNRVRIVMLLEGRRWRIDLFQRANAMMPIGGR